MARMLAINILHTYSSAKSWRCGSISVSIMTQTARRRTTCASKPSGRPLKPEKAYKTCGGSGAPRRPT
eukprot:15924841-Heterocapsa_arctica.AAC.1